mgnify:CR=1 FL=1
MSYVAQSIGQFNSWTPTFTGFSADPTGTHRYSLNGKMCTVNIHETVNASNATTFTFTLPYNSKNTIFIGGLNYVDNGAQSATYGKIELTAGSNIVIVRTSGSSGAWTSSGNKAIRASFTYEIE